MHTGRKFLILTFLLVVSFLFSGSVRAATLSLSPANGTFVVGSTFDVDVILDTNNQPINALDVYLHFPPDKLQVASPSTGQSIVGIWTAQPDYNNQTGIVHLQGGFPGGINVSRGLAINLTFRVKAIGDTIVKFADNSRILLNDGKGTDVLKNTSSGYYEFVLPPPEGPIVFSRTEPDQSRWYSNQQVVFDWTSPFTVQCYSYVLDEDPAGRPDNICDSTGKRVVYQNVENGTHYFHIKSLRDGVWGGVTDFAINIDTEPPAEFPINVAPAARTSSRNPVVEFATTDRLSGIDHYEYKLVSLTPGNNNTKFPDSFFIEGQSPQVLSLPGYGDYDFIVHAYDKAGNFRETVAHLEIRPALLTFVSDKGMVINDQIVIPWLWTILIFLVILGALGYGSFKARAWHHAIILKQGRREMPVHVREKLKELRKYRERYGKALLLFLILGSLMFGGKLTLAQTSDAPGGQVQLPPPLVTSLSRNISNQDIFYVGGKTDTAGEGVVIYLQNLGSGETTSYKVTANKQNDWFYRHSSFLPVGDYLLWTQSQLGDQMSPPSAQMKISVNSTAIQFGASRVSYETLYLILFLIFLVVACSLIGYGIFHFYHARKKNKIFLGEVHEAEESVRRGFAVLRRDIEAELAVVRKAKLNKKLSAEEKAKEEQLLKDLENVRQYIGKEIWDIESYPPQG